MRKYRISNVPNWNVLVYFYTAIFVLENFMQFFSKRYLNNQKDQDPYRQFR